MPGMDKDRLLAERATNQIALAGVQDIAAAGLTNRQLRRRKEEGRLLSFRRGVYLVNGAPRSWEQAVLAACLVASPAAVASHATAAYLRAFPRSYCPDEIEITVPYPLNPRLAGVRAHRVTTLAAADVSALHGVPVTTAARTVCDLATGLTVEQLGELVDNLVRHQQLRIADLRTCVLRLQEARVRRPIVKLRTVLGDRRTDEAGGSQPQLRVYRLLRDAGLPVELEYEVVVGGARYRVDMAIVSDLVGIEYEGWDGHSTRTDLIRNSARTNALTAAGWDLRFVTSAMSDEQILGDVKAAIARSRQRWAG